MRTPPAYSATELGTGVYASVHAVPAPPTISPTIFNLARLCPRRRSLYRYHQGSKARVQLGVADRGADWTDHAVPWRADEFGIGQGRRARTTSVGRREHKAQPALATAERRRGSLVVEHDALDARVGVVCHRFGAQRCA